MQSGNIWEGAMAASHYKLDNITSFVDRNKLQIDGPTEQIMSIEPLAFKWKSFGWHVIEINGHSFSEILGAVEHAGEIKGKPTMIIAHTTKGKGVSFMEGALSFHGKAPSRQQCEQALKELGD
jgi:transketolase